MALPTKQPKVFGVSDLRITKMLTDVAGSAPTYDSTTYDIPGVKLVSYDPDVTEVEGRGDERIMEVEVISDKASVSFEALYFPMEAAAMVDGGAVADATDYSTYYDPGPEDMGEYFRVEALSKSKLVRMVWPKVRGRLVLGGLEGGAFKNTTFKGTAIHTTGNINSKPRRYYVTHSTVALAIGGVCQVETATVVAGSGITLAGNATVVVTKAGMTGTPITLSVAVALADSANVVAEKIRAAMMANANIAAVMLATVNGAVITATALAAAANDATFNISIDNGTCTGLTTAATSANTVAGVANIP